jgi:aminopeptidase N
LKVFGEILGPYPRKTLTIVEGDFLDGMEFDGLFFLGHAFYDYFVGGGKNNLIIISAHETAHQWWYAQVGNDQALEPWLDEALATFSEALFYERVYPDLSQWWWDNRIYFHKPEGWVDSTIYNVAGFYPYRSAVYLRGALFLRDVRHLIGDDAFFSFLKDYLQRYRGKIATGNDFFAVLQEHTTADLSGLLRMYFANR